MLARVYLAAPGRAARVRKRITTAMNDIAFSPRECDHDVPRGGTARVSEGGWVAGGPSAPTGYAPNWERILHGAGHGDGDGAGHDSGAASAEAAPLP